MKKFKLADAGYTPHYQANGYNNREEYIGDQPEPPSDEDEARRYHILKVYWGGRLIKMFYGDKWADKTMADVENLLDKFK